MAPTDAQITALKNAITALQQRCQRLENAVKTLQGELARVRKG